MNNNGITLKELGIDQLKGETADLRIGGGRIHSFLRAREGPGT
jgi:hypothetical protein